MADIGAFDTSLNPDEEAQFQAWKQKMAPNDSGADYDLRGAFKAGLAPSADNGHWPDTFKKPNHPTFSDQSQYAKDRPDLAGHWNGDQYISSKVQIFDLPPPGEEQNQVQMFPSEPETPTANKNSPEQTHMTATLAAFAQKLNDSSDQTISDLMDTNEDKIKQGKETELRNQVADQYKQQQIDSLQKLQTQALATNPSDYTVDDAFKAETDTLLGTKESTALEQQGTSAIQSRHNDPDQAALTAYLGAGRRVQADFAAKAAIFNEKLDKLKTASETEPLWSRIPEAAAEFTGIPQWLSKIYQVPDKGTEFKWPSTNVNDQSNYLWSLSPEDFGKALDEVIDRGNSHSGPSLTYENLKELAGPNIGIAGQSALGYNILNLAAPATLIPVLKIAKYASGLARATGNRVLSSDITAAGILTKASGVDNPLGHVQPIEASIAETIPSVSVPDTISLARGDVGTVSDVADKLEAIQKATSAVRATLSKVARLEPSQVYEALQKAIKYVQTTYRDNPIADIKREVISDTEPMRDDFKAAEEPFVQTKPSKTKEFIGTGSGKKNPVKEVPTYHPNEADLAEMDPDSLVMLNEHGQLRPVKLDTAPGKAKIKQGTTKKTGQSKVKFEVDDDTDVDTLSHFNARGEIYPTEAPTKEPSYRVNPFQLQREHDLELYQTPEMEAAQGEFTIKAYHGTASEFDQFHPRHLGAATNALDSKQGAYFFSEEPHIANGYASFAEGAKTPPNAHQNVRPAYLSIKNPYVADFGGRAYNQTEISQYIAAAKRTGKDGIIIHNINDDVTSGMGRKSTVYAVFDPKQIKGAFEELPRGPGPKVRPAPSETGSIGGIRSIPTVSKSPSTGLYSLNFYVGKDQSAGGFLTEAGARAAMERRGMGGATVHQTLDGNWYIKVNHIVPESGIATKVVDATDYPAVYKASQFVKSLDGLTAMLHNAVRKGQVVGMSRYLAKVIEPYAKNIKKLNSKETKILSSVLASGESERKWFSMAELYDKYNAIANRLPTQQEQLAYYSAKELSDLNYHIRNDGLYTAKARRGVITATVKNPEIKFDTGRVNAQVVHPDEAKGQNIFVADDGSWSKGIRKDLQLLIDTGHYKMVQLEKTIMKDGKAMKYILTHDDSLVTEPLDRRQLEYSEGGSRENANRFFVKQANYVVDEDGHKTWLDPHTHVTGPTRIALEPWAAGMNKAREIYTNSALNESEKRLLMDRTPIESYDKFEKMVKEGQIHPETPFEVLEDNQNPEYMKRIGENDTNWTDPNLRGEESYYLTQGRMYYSEKGERLRDPAGNLAPILNPLTTLRKSVYNAARTNALGDYNTKVIEDWVKAANPYMDHTSLSDNPNPWESFFHGRLLDQGLSAEQQTIVRSLDIGREAHKRFMGFRDLDQTTQAIYLKRLANTLEHKGKLGERAAQVIYNRLSDNPISAVRDLVFQGYFGFLNLRRFVLHASQAVGAMAVDPIKGLTAAGMGPITSALVHINRSDKLLDYVARKMGPDLGMSVQDYKHMVQSLRYSGWLNVSGEVAQLDRYADRWGGTLLTKGWDAIKKWGPTPFNSAIYIQRLTGYHIAWQMARERMPQELYTSAKFQGFVNNMTDTLTGNMTTASSAAWQKGVWSVPTQFLSWQARMFENLLPQTFGGSKVLSGQQKAKYLLGQAVMWGASGVPILGGAADIIEDLYRKNTGQQIDPDTHRAITKGLVDSLIHGFSGSDTDLASSSGLGAAFNQTIEGFGSGDINPFLSMMGGPVYETGVQAYDHMAHFVNYMKAEQVDDLSADQLKLAIKDALPLVQGFKFDLQAYWAWKYHYIKDTKTGQLLLDDATTADAITQGLGIPNVWQTAKPHYYQTEKDRQETIDDVAKQIVRVRRDEWNAIESGDQKAMDHYSNVVRVLMQPWRDQPLMSQQIAKRTTELMTGGYAGTEKQQLINREFKDTGFVPAEANGDQK